MSLLRANFASSHIALAAVAASAPAVAGAVSWIIAFALRGTRVSNLPESTHRVPLDLSWFIVRKLSKT